MAEKKKLGVFEKTGAGQPATDNSDLESGKVRPIGVGLREGTVSALDEIADQYEISRGGVMRLALQLFIIDHRAGKVNLSQYLEEPPPPKKKIISPAG